MPTQAQTSALAALVDQSDAEAEFRDHVIAGLSKRPRALSSKYFYDSRGSELFDQICDLPEYYPTRTEIGLLDRHGPEIAALIGKGASLVEFGSGASRKIRVLLDHLPDLGAYAPIDISREFLMSSAEALAKDYPKLAIVPICADFMRPFSLPPEATQGAVCGFFPGSTIGNFTPVQARAFLEQARAALGAEAGLLIGVDVKKDPALLRAAYNDAQGVTADFNLNVLRRIHDELDAEVDITAFSHEGRWNGEKGRIEMHLVSRRDQVLRVDAHDFAFAAGESICTEYSHKFTPEEFAAFAASAGWRAERLWQDPDKLFSLHFLRAR